MKQFVLATLLAAAGAASLTPHTLAQTGTDTGAAGATGASGSTGQVQMSQDEYNVYQAAKAQTAPAARAQAFQDYLTKYPNSAVKTDVLSQILFAQSQTGNEAAVLTAADNLLAVEPNNLRALAFEVYYRTQDATKLTDPTAKQQALDQAASFAQRGLNATQPKSMSDTDFNTLKQKATPTFIEAISADDMAKKDFAGAVSVLKPEITSAQPADLNKVGPLLQDEYTLANAYWQQTPPDYLDCAWYATRAAQYAPPAAKTNITQLANYCYAKYHGSADGYAQLQTLAQASVTPPDNLGTTITPAPKPEDLVKQTIANTPDLATLALTDKEFIIQYGQPADADKVFDTIKGKTVEIPNATVIAATPDQLQLAVSPDSVQAKTADFTVAMKTPLTTPPAVGATTTVTGTYASYTQQPLMITLSDGSVAEPKKEAPARTTHTTHPTTHRH